GIDAVASRSDGARIAIQCKSRKLDKHGRGASIVKREIDSFSSLSQSIKFDERWVVTNGDNPLAPNALSSVPKEKPIKLIDIGSELQRQMQAFEYRDEDCPNCSDANAKQTRTCMQNVAVATSLSVLRKHMESDSGSSPKGEARGKIILPCGTGKTRIALRIVEDLTRPGEVAVVLCPSIALVSQLRREFLLHTRHDIRSMAVCSDETAGGGRPQ
ncbi:MAG: DEAD/DEAH box helicase family protein, partial [Rhodobacteraceae bacterium]|nr:DEAD/DEAH box helicase family protein [Paracoccaceae bacterium]